MFDKETGLVCDTSEQDSASAQCDECEHVADECDSECTDDDDYDDDSD